MYCNPSATRFATHSHNTKTIRRRGLYQTRRAPYAFCTLSACVPCKMWRLRELLGGSFCSAACLAEAWTTGTHKAECKRIQAANQRGADSLPNQRRQESKRHVCAAPLDTVRINNGLRQFSRGCLDATLLTSAVSQFVLIVVRCVVHSSCSNPFPSGCSLANRAHVTAPCCLACCVAARA